jgi:ATP-dependent exoDNAse (exonuclease V) beta subunit
MNPAITPASQGRPQGDDLLRIDAESRQAAIDPRQSFIVEAPAGAGKTELLTQRFLALLASVKEPEEIVALTFTNKAAAEMRQRIVSSLEVAASGVEPDLPHKKTTFALATQALNTASRLGWDLLRNPNRLQITTLDAFCGKLARQMPLLSRMGTQARVSVDAAVHYEAAALATLEALEHDIPQASSIERVLRYFDNDGERFQAALIDMLKSRDQWLRHFRHGLDLSEATFALREWVESELQAIDAALPLGWQTTLMPWARMAASSVRLAQQCGDDEAKDFPLLGLLEDWAQPLPAQAGALPLWRALEQFLLTQKGEIRVRVPKVMGFSIPQTKAEGQAFKAFLEHLKFLGVAKHLERIRKLPSPDYGPEEEQLLQDLVTVLKVAVAQLNLVFAQAGEIDFIGIAQAALEALASTEGPTDLALKLDHGLHHLLVDEFQDTSPTQVSLLSRLIEAWQPGDGRTLFVVGDPMQSIYKFRKAEVGLFLKVKDHGLNGYPLRPLQLYRNNRSTENVVEWINRVFPEVFAAENDAHRGAVCFSSAKASKAIDAQSGVHWHPILAQDADADSDEALPSSSAELEAQKIVELVRGAQARNPKPKIAILVRARTHLESLVALLRAKHPDLRYQAIEIESLSQKQAVQDLLSLTRALLHLADRVHWLAILRAPWCGLLLNDLHLLAADDHEACVWTLMNDDARVQAMSEDGQQRLLRVREVLRQGFEHQGRLRVRRWVEGIWQALGGVHSLGSPADLLDAQAYFDLLDQLDVAGRIDLARLETKVGELFAATDPSADGTIQIMTIHKSKGLEFDAVILPGLHRKSQGADRKLLTFDELPCRDGQERLAVAVLPRGKARGDGGPGKFDLLQQFEAERARHETQRLLYVAATRAERCLHLVACLELDAEKEEGVRAPNKESFLHLLWHDARPECMRRAEEAGVAASATEQTAVPAPGTGAGTELGLPLNTRPHLLVRLKSGPSLHEIWPGLASGPADAAGRPAPAVIQETSAEAPADRLKADIGVLIHRYLQLVAEDGPSHWSPERLEQLREPMAQWLRNQGHSVEASRASAQEVLTHLGATLQSEAGRWVLAASDEAVCEKSYTTVHEGQLRIHVIDRSFKEAGVRWIVDYKTTDQVKTDATELSEEIREQLLRYRSLFPAEENVKLMVLYTKTGSALTFE